MLALQIGDYAPDCVQDSTEGQIRFHESLGDKWGILFSHRHDRTPVCHNVATPVNWQEGQDCIIVPAVTDADADTLFPKGHKKLKPYLRITPQPNV